MIKKLGTAFYREYLRRMMEAVRNELDYIIYGSDIPDEYYPDLMSISSKTIVAIFKDYTLEIPSYIRELSWEKDYSADCYADDVILEIEEFYLKNKKACHIDKENIIIELGTDKNSLRKLDSWKNILPAELTSTVQTTKECSKIIINRHEFENKLGHTIGGFSLFRRR